MLSVMRRVTSSTFLLSMMAMVILMVIVPTPTTAQESGPGIDSAAVDSTEYYSDEGSEEIVVTVTASRVYRTAGNRRYGAIDFALTPKNSSQDLLGIVPGLVTSQHAGGGKAEQIFLRGFDADHGTDVNITIDGTPVNMVSHGHGQGYADLHFIMPETVAEIEVAKGPYLATHGDLATAGAISLRTIDTLEHNVVKVEGGSFETFRLMSLVRATPDDSPTHAFVGAEIYGSRGFVEAPQELDRFIFFGKAVHPTGERGKIDLTLSGFASEWNASGQIPERAVQSGRITRFGSIDSSEGGATSRTTLAFGYETGGANPFRLTLSGTDYRFRLFSNFTYLARDSVQGDGIEQTDDRMMWAMKGEKTFVTSVQGIPNVTSFGIDVRNDDIEIGLFASPQRRRSGVIQKSRIGQRHIAPFISSAFVLPFARLYLGIRADYFLFDVEDLDSGTGESGLVDALALSPKASIALPISPVTLFFNSGIGFHSNDARVVVQGNVASPPRAYGFEVGARLGEVTDAISLSGSLWSLELEEELVYVGDEGTTEASGATMRRGIDVEAHLSPLPWIGIGVQGTLSSGRFLDAPAGEDRIPLAPDLTLSAEVLLDLDPLRSLLQVRHISDRPANESNSVIAVGYTLVDLSTTWSLGSVELSLIVENVWDSKWKEAQFDTESRLEGEAEPISEIHFTPGTPRSIRAGAAIRF